MNEHVKKHTVSFKPFPTLFPTFSAVGATEPNDL